MSFVSFVLVFVNMFKIIIRVHLIIVYFYLLIVETTCLTPANVIGALVSIGNLTVGSNVTYRAQNTYHHVRGDLVRTCREDELWTGKQPVFQGNIRFIGWLCSS